MSALDDFRARPTEEVECSVRAHVVVRPQSVWVGIYRAVSSSRPDRACLWSATYDRPEGKSTAQCVEAGLRAACLAQEAGMAVA